MRRAKKGTCIVEFCRMDCETIPDNVEVIRASHLYICPACQAALHMHPAYAYPSGMGHCVKGCDGRFYHL